MLVKNRPLDIRRRMLCFETPLTLECGFSFFCCFLKDTLVKPKKGHQKKEAKTAFFSQRKTKNVHIPWGKKNITIYKSLFLSKFFVRVTARSKTMIFKPTTPLDGEKSSLWISNFWAKSFLPFDLYHEKSCKNGEISTRPQAHHFVENTKHLFPKVPQSLKSICSPSQT